MMVFFVRPATLEGTECAVSFQFLFLKSFFFFFCCVWTMSMYGK